MSDLYWPGDARAGDLMSDRSLVAAMVAVERTWYDVLADAGIAPTAELPSAAALAELTDAELADLSAAAESGGNPVIPLLGLLRTRLEPTAPEAARWWHRGLTSQDVLDTALVLQLRDVLDAVQEELLHQVRALRDLADQHRDTRLGRAHPDPARGADHLRAHGRRLAAGQSSMSLDELQPVRRSLPVQVGGAAGTLAAVAELSGGGSVAAAAGRAVALADDLATRLGLQPAPPWHGNRRPLTRVADILVAVTDAAGRIANDVLLRARPEIAELSEAGGPGRGDSSTMPHKQNPVLSVLIRRAALVAPGLGATIHAAAAAAVDDRPDGGWHAEWAPLRTLARQTVVAGRQTTELVTHLVVHRDRMRDIAAAAADDLLAEQRAIREHRGVTEVGNDPPTTWARPRRSSTPRSSAPTGSARRPRGERARADRGRADRRGGGPAPVGGGTIPGHLGRDPVGRRRGSAGRGVPGARLGSARSRPQCAGPGVHAS